MLGSPLPATARQPNPPRPARSRQPHSHPARDTDVRVELSTTGNITPSSAHRGSYEIGEVATLVGLSLRTVRFYEEAGLLVAVGQADGGGPLYDDDALDRFLLIKKMKPLGFTLDEMRALVGLREEIEQDGLPRQRREELHERLSAWVSLAEDKLASLQEQVRVAEDFMVTLHDDTVRARLRFDADPDAY
ncbi:transcriptional regulator, MerR family [Parafrankia sp. EUN1f]|nr:transcriptional regulator, MerR family [Parafrankia sp. EUN1f]